MMTFLNEAIWSAFLEIRRWRAVRLSPLRSDPVFRRILSYSGLTHVMARSGQSSIH